MNVADSGGDRVLMLLLELTKKSNPKGEWLKWPFLSESILEIGTLRLYPKGLARSVFVLSFWRIFLAANSANL